MLDRFHRRAFDNCVPLTVTLEITLRCNLRCAHCYNFDRSLPNLPILGQDRELSDAEILRVIDEVRAEGCLYLSFTGGEALVHPSLDVFVRHAQQSGMLVVVKTNGVLLDDERAHRLAAAGAAGVEISLYGAEAATHDALVRAPGAFAQTCNGARAARDAGMRPKFSFVVVQSNADQVGKMMSLATEMGVPYSIDPQITARYDGTRSSLELRVDRATLERLYREDLRALLPPVIEDPTTVQCACARSVCGISALGEVLPCIGAPIASGNLRERSFHEIWTSSPVLERIRGLGLVDFAACAGCDHLAHCRRSSGVIYTNTGNYTGPATFGDDWTCMEAEVIHAIHDEASPATPNDAAGFGALRRHSHIDPNRG